MEIKKFGVKELTAEEQLQITGGGWLADVWNAICDAAEWLWDHIKVTESYNQKSGWTISISNK
jgi:hypothetical protein